MTVKKYEKNHKFYKDMTVNRQRAVDDLIGLVQWGLIFTKCKNTVELKYPTAVTEFLAVFTNDSWYTDINDLIIESQSQYFHFQIHTIGFRYIEIICL